MLEQAGPPTEFLSDCQLGELVVGEEKSGMEIIISLSPSGKKTPQHNL